MEIEKELIAKKLTAPRITPEHINRLAGFAPPQYHVFPGTTTTVCCLNLPNGFTVIGTAACVSAKNFDREIGEKIAFLNAKQQIWTLEGYLLAEQEFIQRAEGT